MYIRFAFFDTGDRRKGYGFAENVLSILRIAYRYVANKGKTIMAVNPLFENGTFKTEYFPFNRYNLSGKIPPFISRIKVRAMIEGKFKGLCIFAMRCDDEDYKDSEKYADSFIQRFLIGGNSFCNSPDRGL